MDYEQAIVAFTAAIEIDPEETAAYLGRAEAYLGGDIEEASEESLQAALEDYDTVLEFLDGTAGEESVEAYVGIAEIYIIQEDYNSAEQTLEEGIAVNPDSDEIQILIESVYDLIIEEYISETYGISSDSLHAVYTASVVHEYGKTTLDSSTLEYDADSDLGAVYYKIIKDDDGTTDAVCVYLQEVWDTLYLKLDYLQNFSENGFPETTHSRTIGEALMKATTSYCLIKGDYVIVVWKAESNAGFYSGEYYLSRDVDETDSSSNYFYEEKVSVYELDDEFTELISLEIELTPPDPNETEVCKLMIGDEIWIYTSGFSSYNYEGSVTFLSTEEEFCDLVNESLEELSIDEVVMTGTSWENRWYGTELDEGDIPYSGPLVKTTFKKTS